MAGHGLQYGVCTLHAGYLRLQIHTLRLCNTHCFSTATMVARTRHVITFYVHCLSSISSVSNFNIHFVLTSLLHFSLIIFLFFCKFLFSPFHYSIFTPPYSVTFFSLVSFGLSLLFLSNTFSPLISAPRPRISSPRLSSVQVFSSQLCF